jgi:hypothetical protein
VGKNVAGAPLGIIDFHQLATGLGAHMSSHLSPASSGQRPLHLEHFGFLGGQLGTLGGFGVTGPQVVTLVTETSAATGAAELGPRGIGKVMGALQPKVKGKADGGAVSAEVKRQLAG